MSSGVLETVERETGGKPTASVIWMHGLGADAYDFDPVVPLLDLGPDRPVRYVFPNAPVRPVTVNGGYRMRAWYDVRGIEINAGEDDAGIRDSAAAIEALISRELGRGIAADRIVLAGFSQGGAMALHTGLRYSSKLAGLLILSAYLPLADSVAAEALAANRSTPIFMGHGEVDNVVPLWIARASRDQLTKLGYAVQWHTYPMPHSVAPEELQDIRAFLAAVL
jgi:phospholipase/carboxylesterase